MESTTDEPTQSKLHRSEGGYRQAAPMQNLQAAPSQMHLSERRVMNHSEQIEAHVRIEAAQDLHRELQAIQQWQPKTDADKYAYLFGAAKGALHNALDRTPNPNTSGIDFVEAEFARLFPDRRSPAAYREDFDFEPSRYYGEGKNE